MNLRSAEIIINGYLREQFGRVVELRGVRVTRQASGRLWVGDVYRSTQYGEVRVGSVGVDEAGRLRVDFGVEELVDVLSRVQPVNRLALSVGAGLGDDDVDLSELLMDDGYDTFVEGHVATDELEECFAGLDTPSLRRQIRRLLSSAERADLLEAREKLPLLLPSPEGRGEVLHRMAELEFLLGDVDVGLTYLEAAAREFADRASMQALEFIAGRAEQVLGHGHRHGAAEILDQTRQRLRPLASLEEVPVFADLGDPELARLEAAAEQVGAARGTVIIREEDTPVWAYAVKSGVLSIWIEPPSGGSRFVRCCFPGEFVGETSILGGIDTTCTATVRAEHDATMWKFGGFQLRALTDELPELARRIEDTATRHRLDSFFSTGEATSILDVRVRDRLLGCFSEIVSVDRGQVVVVADAVPDRVYLLVDGRVACRVLGAVVREERPSVFLGLRSLLHGVAHEGEWVTVEASRFVVFDADRLQAMATSAPPDVMAVLESLE